MSNSVANPIPFFYRLFLCTLEPIGAVGGTLQAHFTPHPFITLQFKPGIVFTVTPELQMVLTQEASLYLFFAAIETITLRSTKDMKVCNSVLFAIILADLGHLWGLYVIGGHDISMFWRAWDWTVADWIVWGVTVVSFAVRVSYFLGLGFSKTTKCKGKGKRV